MYTKKQLSKAIARNIKVEFDVIMFYLDNLHKLNYQKNQNKIRELIM